MSTAYQFGPVYREEVDGAPLAGQMIEIRDYMLDASARGRWLTVKELCRELHRKTGKIYPETSVEAQLRHLRKAKLAAQHGGPFHVPRRKRTAADGTVLRVSEYAVFPLTAVGLRPLGGASVKWAPNRRMPRRWYWLLFLYAAALVSIAVADFFGGVGLRFGDAANWWLDVADWFNRKARGAAERGGMPKQA